MKSDKTRELVELSLYAALIIVSVQFIRIPFGPQFVHLGNALVVIAVLIFGARKGALVATVGLGHLIFLMAMLLRSGLLFRILNSPSGALSCF